MKSVIIFLESSPNPLKSLGLKQQNYKVGPEGRQIDREDLSPTKVLKQGKKVYNKVRDWSDRPKLEMNPFKVSKNIGTVYQDSK